MRIQLSSIRILRVVCLLSLLAVVCGYWPAQSGCATARSGDFQKKFDLPQDPEALLQDILSRKEFKDATARSLLERLRAFLHHLWRRALSWILDRLPDLGPISLGNESIWSAVGILLITVLLALIIIGLTRFFLPVFRKSGNQEPGSPIQEIEMGELGEMQEQALQAAQEGDYRKALILLFRFVLLKLDEMGHIKWRTWKTNREILRSLRQNATAREPLSEMISIFNGIYYGGKPCAKPEFQRFLILTQLATGGSRP
jgi:hypothetical protein